MVCLLMKNIHVIIFVGVGLHVSKRKIDLHFAVLQMVCIFYQSREHLHRQNIITALVEYALVIRLQFS